MTPAVVILTSNRPGDLRRAVASVREQSRCRIVVVSAKSVAGSLSALEMLQGLGPIVHLPGFGTNIGASRLLGTEHAFDDGTDVVIELDDDDYLLPGVVSRILAEIEDADAVYGDFEYWNNGIASRARKEPYESGCFEHGCWSKGVRAFRKEAYHRVGKHNRYLSLCEDYDLFIRFDLDEQVRVACIQEPLAHVSIRGDGISTLMYPEVAGMSRSLIDLYYGGGR